MAQIAIKGHPTRDKEVIEILEMLGGHNDFNLTGDTSDLYYYIYNDNKIIYTCTSCTLYTSTPCNINDFKIFTVEEFLEKYPYKVGDKVTVTGLPEYPKIINFMEWFNDNIHYSFDDETWFLPSELNLYKEETTETITIDDFKANTKEWLIDKLHDMVISKAIKTIGDIHEELHKPQYPKTYDECVDMFNCTVETVNLTTIAALRELIYCRNVYWKIAGEQMRLGKPWEPEYPSKHYIFTIENQSNNIIKNAICDRWRNRLLIFPTEEMRDEFYENFKELIEMCKEFL